MAQDSVLALPRREITCSLCNKLFQTPYSFTSCGHCFCYCCIHRKLRGSSRPVCPACSQPVQITELYYNHQCHKIVRAVQSCQQGSAGISAVYGRQEDRVCQTGCTLAEGPSMQQLSLQEPALNVHPVSAVSTGQTQGKDVQAVQVHQQDRADAGTAQDSFTVRQAAAALLQEAQAAGDCSSSLSTPQLPASLWCYNHEWALKVAAMSPLNVTGRAAMDVEQLAVEAVLADLRQCLQAAGCDVFDVDKQPTVGSQPANAVSAALHAASSAQTGTAQAQCDLSRLPVTTVSSRHASTDCCGAQEPDTGQLNATKPNPTRQAMLCGTAESLADIDAVMQARGYRLSCMPGPSGLPNTLASYGAEIHSPGLEKASCSYSLDKDSPLVYHGLEAETACSDKLPDCVAVQADIEVPTYKCLMGPSSAQPCGSLQPAADDASQHTGAAGGIAEPSRLAAQQQAAQQAVPLYQGNAHTGPSHEYASALQPQCPVVSPAAGPQHSSSQQPAASLTGAANTDTFAMHSQQPAVTATDGVSGAASPVHRQQQAPICTGVANHDASPTHSQQPETSETQAINAPTHRQQPAVISNSLATDEAPPMHSQQPAGTPTTAGNGGDAAAADDDDDGDVSSMHAAAGEDTTVPDSVGHTQLGCCPSDQAMHTGSPSSSGHSHTPSDGASFKAALALAALASGEKQPRASGAQGPNAQAAELSIGSRKQWQHQQCDSDRVPLKTIQRTAAVQRQPLKPGWQQSGRAEASWGGKGRRTRTRTHLHKPPTSGMTAMQRSRGAKHMQSLSNKQGNSSKAVGVSQSGLSSDSTAAEAEDASKPSHTTGVPLGSAETSTQVGTSRAKVVGTNQPGCNLHARLTPPTVRSDLKLASEGQGSRPEQPKIQQLQCGTNDGVAAVCGNDGADDDDDDDIKPDVRRQPKGHGSSPRGNRKRARLLQPEACPGDKRPGVRSGAQGGPVGQVLLSWNARQRCWNQRIITAFSASKSLFHVKGDNTAAEWKDLTEVQWMQPGGSPHHCMLICQLVKQSIEIWWPQDETYYKGTVTKYLPDKEKHHVLYDDGEEEDEDLGSQQFRFCPALVLLDESLLPVPGQPDGDLTHSIPAASSPHSIRKATVSAEPAVHGHSLQLKLQQAVKPAAFLDATNACSPLSHNPEAAETASQGNNHKPVSAGQPKKLATSAAKQTALDAAAAPDACMAAPTSKIELAPVLQQAAAPQRKADAFDYPASQAENVGSQHSAPSSTASPSNCKPGRHRGRKRARGKQVAPAKRQKQLQGTRGRAASKAPKSKQADCKQVTDGARHQLRRSRLAEPACQVVEGSPNHGQPEVKAEAEPQGNLGTRQTPLPDTGAHARKRRQLESPQDQQQEGLLQVQMEQQQHGLGEQHESQQNHQQQQRANGDVSEQADAGPTGKTEGGACHPARKVVVGSGLPRPKQDEIKRLCRRLRAHPGIAVDSHTTHIVVQVDAAGVGQQRSLKYFQGLARGCWLVSWEWVEACAAAGQWLNEEPFELAGDHFALGAPRTARLKWQPGAKGLFQGMSFWMGPGYQGTGVSPHQLTELLTCTGGRILDSLPPRLTDGSTADLQADDCHHIHVLLFGENTAGPEQIRSIKEQTGTWPLLLSWVLDSLSSQNALPVAQYQERV